MFIEWEKLYNLCGKNNKLTGMEFEKIVLRYLSEFYPQYSWKNTKSSWDNNRDFISLVLENIWAEAKYKKDCSPIKKQDVDPTVMSGLINGNIEIIFFITNGYLPNTIMERIKQISNMYLFNIICITRIQLEYWLMLRPDVYEFYFKEKLPLDKKLPAISIIKNIEIIDYTTPNNDIFALKTELLENRFYVMNITFEANILSKAEIINKDYPFSFVNANGYAFYNNIDILPGIQQIQLLIHTDRCIEGNVSIEYNINGKDVCVYSINLNIYPDSSPTLSYSQQLIFKEEIINYLSINTVKGRKILIKGRKGVGKAYLLTDIFQHFRQTRQTVHFKFHEKNDFRNNILLCRLISFINFGEIVRIFNIENSDLTIDYCRAILESTFDPIGGDIDLILEIFEGCYDEIVAKKIISMLIEDEDTVKRVILPKKTPVSHLAIIDISKELSEDENFLINNIINHAITCNDACFVLATQENNYSADYILTGLSFDDKKYSLKQNFKNWSDAFINIIAKELSYIPSTFCESIQYLKINLEGNTDEKILSSYILLSDKTKKRNSYELNCELEKNYICILGFIYTFNAGISKSVIYNLGITNEQINYLEREGYIRKWNDKISAYSQLLRSIFIDTYKLEFSDAVISYLHEILKKPELYKKYVFLPEVYSIYCTYKEINSQDITQEMLNKLSMYSYKCEYRNLYAYGNIAYYFISKKSTSELSENDYIAMFYYGLSLLHCDRKRGAIEIFKNIKTNAQSDSNIYYMASCELFNNLYNRFQINELEAEIIITKIELEQKINNLKTESSQDTLNLRIAYSTCLNRYMMILFMQDRYNDAKEIFKDYRLYNKKIPNSKYYEKYNSMLGEWYLDYARGISYDNANEAKSSLETGIDMINKNLNEKRYILAKLYLSFLKCVYFKAYKSEINNIHSIVIILKEKKFENEYVRGFIIESFCRLIYYLQNNKIAKSNGLNKILIKMKEDALSVELDTMLYITGRLAYQIRNFFAAIEMLLGNHITASFYLEQNLKLVEYAGDSYKSLILHNLKYINKISTVKWGFKENTENSDAYLVDPRIW